MMVCVRYLKFGQYLQLDTHQNSRRNDAAHWLYWEDE